MTNPVVLKCQHCSKEYVRPEALERHIKTKQMDQAAQFEQDKTHPEIRIEIPSQGPYFQDLNIPDDMFMHDDNDDLELYAIAEEIEKSCNRCEDNSNNEKRMKKQVKALQVAKRHLQKTNKNCSIELEHCREMLANNIKELTKIKMERQAKESKDPDKGEDIEVEGGIDCTYCDYKHMTEHNTQPKLYSCGHCEYSAISDQDLENHMTSKHDFTVKSTKQCHFYKKGTCDRPSTCRYRHEGPVEKSNPIPSENPIVQRETPKCNRGSGCSFKAQGRCYYFHEGVGVQMQRDNQSQKSPEESHRKTTQKLWCKFQDSCLKGHDKCPFRHYEFEFPRLPTRHVGNLFR